MAQKGCLCRVNELLAGCKMNEVAIFGGRSLYGYILTPIGILPMGEDLGISIQLKKWNLPPFAKYQ